MLLKTYRGILRLLRGKLPIYPAYAPLPERSERLGIFGVISVKSFKNSEKPEAEFSINLMGSSNAEELISAGEKVREILTGGELNLEIISGECGRDKISGLLYPLTIKAHLYEKQEDFVFPISEEAFFKAESFKLSRKRALQEVSTVDGRSLSSDAGARRLIFESEGRLSSFYAVTVLEEAVLSKREFSFNAEGLLLPAMILKSYEVTKAKGEAFPICVLEFQAVLGGGINE